MAIRQSPRYQPFLLLQPVISGDDSPAPIQEVFPWTSIRSPRPFWRHWTWHIAGRFTTLLGRSRAAGRKIGISRALGVGKGTIVAESWGILSPLKFEGIGDIESWFIDG